jgi:hypothetical protein
MCSFHSIPNSCQSLVSPEVLESRNSFGEHLSLGAYGRPVFEQCGPACAYCGYGTEPAYEAWLNLSIDHVILTGAATRLGYPAEWVRDTANLVTSCRACNEFLNGYKITDPTSATVEEFFDLRDRHFLVKRERVLARHATERAWYDAVFPAASRESPEA